MKWLRLDVLEFADTCVLCLRQGDYDDLRHLLADFSVQWPSKSHQPFVVGHPFTDVAPVLAGDDPIYTEAKDFNEARHGVLNAKVGEWWASSEEVPRVVYRTFIRDSGEVPKIRFVPGDARE